MKLKKAQSFLQNLFALKVIVSSPLRILNVVKIYLRIFAHDDGPPSPHQTTEQFSDYQIIHHDLSFFDVLGFFSQLFKLDLELFSWNVHWYMICINKSDFHLLVLGFFRKQFEVGGLIDWIINTFLLKIVGDIKKWQIEGPILIVNNDTLTIFLQEQYIISQQIIMREDQSIL